MKNANALILCIVIASSFISFLPVAVMADMGLAKVYIISLSGVSGLDDSGTIDPSKVVQGAQSALAPNEDSKVPRVHPKYGKLPPFYSINYEVVSDWTTYKTIIETYTGFSAVLFKMSIAKLVTTVAHCATRTTVSTQK